MVSRMRKLMGVYGARLSVTQLHDVLEWWHAFSVVKRSRRLREVRILEATHCYTGQLRWMYCQWLADPELTAVSFLCVTSATAPRPSSQWPGDRRS